MTKEKKMLDRIKTIVEEIMVIKEEGAYISSPIDTLIEDAYMSLNLDGEFNFTERRILKAGGYKFNKENDVATKTFKKVPIKIWKNGFNFYSIQIGKGRNHGFTDLDDLKDCSGKNFLKLFNDFIND